MQNLEQLLEEIRTPRTGEEKLASPISSSNEELIGRLLKYAAADETSDVALHSAARQELIEKTAKIGVIGLTLAEIDQAIAAPGIKTASAAAVTSDHLRRASRIKVALERGHSEREIAEHLQKAAGHTKKAGASEILSKVKDVARAAGKGAGESSHSLLSGLDKAWEAMTPAEKKRAIVMPAAGVGSGFIGSVAANKLAPSRPSKER